MGALPARPADRFDWFKGRLFERHPYALPGIVVSRSTRLLVKYTMLNSAYFQGDCIAGAQRRTRYLLCARDTTQESEEAHLCRQK